MIRKLLIIVGYIALFVLISSGALPMFFFLFPLGVLMIIAGLTKRLGLVTLGLISDETMEWFYSCFGLFPLNFSIKCMQQVIGGVLVILLSFMSLFFK